MVMSPAPCPVQVGREFVRQYYTQLNASPLLLHRFYNNDSSFVHDGGLTENGREPEAVYGQKQIHQKIMTLNYRDCHAKIRQVDSHETLANGVVVQVRIYILLLNIIRHSALSVTGLRGAFQ